jgi:hypothetical protein
VHILSSISGAQSYPRSRPRQIFLPRSLLISLPSSLATARFFLARRLPPFSFRNISPALSPAPLRLAKIQAAGAYLLGRLSFSQLPFFSPSISQQRPVEALPWRSTTLPVRPAARLWCPDVVRLLQQSFLRAQSLSSPKRPRFLPLSARQAPNPWPTVPARCSPAELPCWPVPSCSSSHAAACARLQTAGRAP